MQYVPIYYRRRRFFVVCRCSKIIIIGTISFAMKLDYIVSIVHSEDTFLVQQFFIFGRLYTRFDKLIIFGDTFVLYWQIDWGSSI